MLLNTFVVHSAFFLGNAQAGGEVNFSRLQAILKCLVGDENNAYQRRAVRMLAGRLMHIVCNAELVL